MKQWNDFPRYGINASNVRSFIAVTVATREGQILENGLAAMLLSNDVFDLKWKDTRGLRKLAVFAAPGTRRSHSRAQAVRHAFGCSEQRAFDLIKSSSLPTWR